MHMRRGVIGMWVPVRNFAGLQMKGGTIIHLMSGAEIHLLSAWMVRRTIVASKPPHLRPQLAYACLSTSPRSCAVRESLQAMGFSIPYEDQARAYERFTGDTSVPGKGEILVWRPHVG